MRSLNLDNVGKKSAVSKMVTVSSVRAKKAAVGATLTAMSGVRGQTSVYAVNGKARALTPREASRMQGLPERAIHHPTKTQAYKHAGNAVAIPLVRELVRPLASTLGTARDSAFSAQMAGGAA